MAAKYDTKKCPIKTSPNAVPSFLRSLWEISSSTLQKSGKIKVNKSYLPSALASGGSQRSYSARKTWCIIATTKNLFLGKTQKGRFWGAEIAWRRHSGSAGNTLWLQADARGNCRDWLMRYHWLGETEPLLAIFKVKYVVLLQSWKTKFQTLRTLVPLNPSMASE